MSKKIKNSTLAIAAGAVAAAIILPKLAATKLDDSSTSTADESASTSGVGSATQYHIKGQITSVKFKNRSTYGNPSYWISILTDGGRALKGYSAPNAGWAYALTSGRTSYPYTHFMYHYTKSGVIVWDEIF